MRRYFGTAGLVNNQQEESQVSREGESRYSRLIAERRDLIEKELPTYPAAVFFSLLRLRHTSLCHTPQYRER